MPDLERLRNEKAGLVKMLNSRATLSPDSNYEMDPNRYIDGSCSVDRINCSLVIPNNRPSATKQGFVKCWNRRHHPQGMCYKK